MTPVINEPPSKEVQAMIARLEEIIIGEGNDGLIDWMTSDPRPATRCFVANTLRDIGFAPNVAFMFERRR